MLNIGHLFIIPTEGGGMKITKLETFNAGAGWPSFSVLKVSTEAKNI